MSVATSCAAIRGAACAEAAASLAPHQLAGERPHRGGEDSVTIAAAMIREEVVDRREDVTVDGAAVARRQRRALLPADDPANMLRG